MRKRKQSPLGPSRAVRTIPITAAELVRDRRPLIPLEPSLVDLATGLLNAGSGSEPAAWTSWALRDQPDTSGFSYWEAPVVDGETCSGGGVGFPEAPADTTPITMDDITSAAAAGWPYDPGARGPARSWVAMVAGVGLDTDDVSAGASPDGSPTPPPDYASFTTLPAFEPSDVHDAMALHPSARVDARSDIVVAPAPSIDPDDFTTRLERGASIALTEQHVHALAARALEQLVPRGTGVWFAEQPNGRLRAELTSAVGDHVGCGVIDRQSCPAIVAGTTQRFDRSDELDACPNLRAAGGPPRAALCVPVRSHGPLRGVLFVSAPVNEPLDDVVVTLTERVAQTIARRVAEVRDAVGSGESAD